MNAPFEEPEEDQDLLRARILGTESEIHLKTWYPSLKGALAELKALNTQLEERVVAATEELRRANGELERKNAALEESRERLLKAEGLAAYGRLAGLVAHELNTPLGALLSAASALPGEAGDTAAAALDLAGLGAGEADFVRRLLSRGLAAARTEPLGLPSRTERARLQARLLDLARDSARNPDPSGPDYRDLAEGLLALGLTVEDGDLLGPALASPRLLDLALRLSAPARSAAIARDAASLAAAAIAKLRDRAGRGGEGGYSGEGDSTPIL